MKKLDVNQELCRKVQIMLAGAKMGEVAELLGISKTTVSRIKAAGFDPEQYAKNTQKRVEEENKAEADPEPEQVAGQICMELQPAEEQKPAEEPDAEDLQTKMMRFLAGKMDKIETRLHSIDAKESTINMSILLKSDEIESRLDKLIDYLAQILRKLDG